MAIGRRHFQQELRRLIALGCVMLGMFIILLAGLWHIQVSRGTQYDEDLRRQSVRRIRLPGMRGNIYDRNGVYLAENRPQYAIAVYLEELRQPGTWSNTINHIYTVLDDISNIIHVPVQVDRDDIWAHIRKRLPLPFIAWTGLTEKELSMWSEQSAGMRGVDVYLQGVRVYPYGTSVSHLLGYVGRADLTERQMDEQYHYYLPDMEGKAGLEKVYDDVLKGEAGGKLVRVDVSGYRYEDLGVKQPHSGADVKLALDLKIQQAAQEAIDGGKGAAVVLDVRNGDVLALASSPGFDPNAFIPSISTKEWKKLIQDPDKPLLNRAVAGTYPPGSTFKPVVAVAALENRIAAGNTAFNCPGYYRLGNTTMDCYHRIAHGTLAMREALARSCNVYFYKLGVQCGVDPIYHMGAALGLGVKTGVDVDYERSGILPNDSWKRAKMHDGWRQGDTCNLAIGQGFLSVTPLQMAVITAALANGGRVYQPRILLGMRQPGDDSFVMEPVSLVRDLKWHRKTLDVVRSGMRDVVMAEYGTGTKARIPGVVMAGKTGTAEYGPKKENRKYGWMIAFAPYDNPRVAVAVVMDDAVSGGTTAGPRVQKIMAQIFHADRAQEGRG